MAVFIGGGLGSVLRFGISEIVRHYFSGNFPLATFISNLLSCFLLGLMVYYLNDKLQQQHLLKLLLVIGVCGGFSTFSSFSYETVTLFKDGNAMLAVANVLFSFLACFGIVFYFLKNQ